MAVRLRLDRLSIDTIRGRHDFELRSPATVLTGPVGGGKSTMLELIRHVLGGNAVLTQVIKDEVITAELRLTAGEERLVLHRSVRGGSAGRVRMVGTDGYELAAGAPVRQRVGERSVSDILLDALGIPALRIPRSRQRASGATTAITFNDLYSYLYVEQQEIDRSVIHHLDQFRNPKRKAVFELLFGLTDPHLLDLEVRLGGVSEHLAEAERESQTVLAFLQRSEAGDEAELKQEEEVLKKRLSEARERLGALRDEVEKLSAAEAALREQVRFAAKESAAARDVVRDLDAEVARRQAAAAQLRVDMDRGDRAAAAGRHIAPIEFTVCPRCLQSLRERNVSAMDCLLCLQPEPRERRAGEEDAAHDRLAAQLEEMLQLLEEAKAQLGVARTGVDDRTHLAEALRAELDERTRDFVTPRFASIAEASAAEAATTARLESLDRVRGLWAQHQQLAARVSSLTDQRHRLKEEVEAARSRLLERRERVERISELFDLTVQELGLPWYESARIDEQTYLPVVNEQPFVEVSVGGGTKTIVNVAYHLTLLAYALQNGDTLLPELLILDSPRKNLGSGQEDQQLSARIYRRLQTLIDTYPTRLQILVADNDLPRGAAQGWHKLHFDYDHPFVPDVSHPGPEHVITIGSSGSSRDNQWGET